MIPSIWRSPEIVSAEIVQPEQLLQRLGAALHQRQVVERELRDQPPELGLAERRLDHVGGLDQRHRLLDGAAAVQLEVAALVAERQPARQVAVVSR